MKLSKFIDGVLKASAKKFRGTITFEVKINEKGDVDEKGKQKLTFEVQQIFKK